jgi:Uma2 family endonuclease
VLFAPLRVRLPGGTFREPDVVFMLAQHAERMGEDYWDGADLVMEVVSEENRQHDLVTKRSDYAEARIPEYWIIDPAQERITVLRLAGNRYETHGEFAPGDRAGSALLAEFEADVSAVFAAAAQ